MCSRQGCCCSIVLGSLRAQRAASPIWILICSGCSCSVVSTDLDLEDGLPLDGGSQLVVDTTLVSALRGDMSSRAGADWRDGVALIAARR